MKFTRRRFIRFIRAILLRLGIGTQAPTEWVWDEQAGVFRNPALSKAIRDQALKDSVYAKYLER